MAYLSLKNFSVPTVPVPVISVSISRFRFGSRFQKTWNRRTLVEIEKQRVGNSLIRVGNNCQLLYSSFLNY
jgi:hypothetical protein